MNTTATAEQEHTVSEKKIDLIAQLLAKAESTTPEEAEALTEHAERLMAKYMIDQAVIDDRRAKAGGASEKIVEFRFDFTGPYRGELLNLGSNVAFGLGTLRSLQSTARKQTFSAWIVGFESDVEQAKTLINSLQLQAAVAVRAWWKGERSEHVFESSYLQEKARRSFVFGFGNGAGIRIRESRNTIVAAESTGTALVLVDRRTKVDEHINQKYQLRSSRGRTATAGGRAAHEGFAAGQQANTGGTSIGHTKGITA